MKKIAIIGGSYLQLPVVLKAKELGLEVHCFSWLDGAVCANYSDYFYPVSIIDKEKILSKCKEIEIDGITTIASDVAVLTVNYVASRMGLISNPDEYSLVTTDKYKMRKCFAENNIPSPRFTVDDGSDKFNVSELRFPLIVKPTDRSGSRGVEKVFSLIQLKKAIVRAKNESFSKAAIIEEFVTGHEISVESISFKGVHHLLQITDKVTTGEPYFIELEHHQPSSLSDNIKQKVGEVVVKALDALQICYGASHSELIITVDDNIKVVEIGARMGGDFIGSHLVQLSTGYDFLEGVIKVAMGEFTEPQITEHRYSGIYFLCKETEYLKTVIENNLLFPEIVEAEITDQVLHNIKCSGDRSGYFIYKSNRNKFTMGC